MGFCPIDRITPSSSFVEIDPLPSLHSRPSSIVVTFEMYSHEEGKNKYEDTEGNYHHRHFGKSFLWSFIVPPCQIRRTPLWILRWGALPSILPFLLTLVLINWPRLEEMSCSSIFPRVCYSFTLSTLLLLNFIILFLLLLPALIFLDRLWQHWITARVSQRHARRSDDDIFFYKINLVAFAEAGLP